MPAIKQRDINARFARLEERVFRIELRLGPETAPATIAPSTEPADAAAIAPALDQPAAAETLPSHLLERRRSHAVPPPLPIRAEISPVPEPMTPAIAPSEPETPEVESAPELLAIPYAAPSPATPAVQGALERTIGLKWAGWAGAVVLVIGAALGVKFVYDQHWFGEVPPAVWLSSIFVAGLGLIGVGEVIYRRVHAIPAASVFGAGVATLFLAGYVGHAYYNLYTPGTALFLMAAAALVGALVAMRGNLVSIAVLSHVGANVAPMLVGSRSAPLESFLIYLLALQIVALRLASWGHGKKWWTLRGLSLATTALWVIGAGLRPGHESLVLLFCAIYAALFQGELIYSAMRRRDDISPTVSGSDAVTFSLLVTVALTLVTLWSTRLLPPGTRGAILLALAAIYACLGWILSTGIKQAPDSIRKLAVAHRIAAAGLVVLAIPVAFSGLQTDFAWGLLAVAFAAAGAKTQSRIARIAGIVTWFLGVMHLAISTYLPQELGGNPAVVWFHLFGTGITRDAGLAFGLSAIGQVIAGFTSNSESETDRTALSLSLVASAVWVIASVLALPPLAATACIVEYAWLLVAAEALVPQLRFSMEAAVLIMLATVKWAIVDTLADRLSPGWSAATYRPVLNPMMGIGALLAASIITLYAIRRKALWRALREQSDSTAGLIVVAAIAVVLLTFGLSFEIDRVVESAVALGQVMVWPIAQEKLLAWTVLWSISTMVMMGIIAATEPAGQQRSRWFKRFWILPALLAAKFVLIDTALFQIWYGSSAASVLMNLQVLAAAMIAGCLLLVNLLNRQPDGGDLTLRRLRTNAILLAALVLMWAVTLEIDRIVEQMNAAGTLLWPPWQAKQLGWTIAWTLAIAGGFAILRWRNPGALPSEPWPRLLPRGLMLLAIKYLTIDTALWRLLRTPANVTVLANLEASAGAVVLASLVMLFVLGLPASVREQEPKMRRIGGLLASLILLWTGSIEIDRYFAAVAVFNGAVRPEQVALSIFWSMFAVACVLLGFRIRAAGLRYFGLALLAVTLLKVALIDMSQVQAGYRILSFLGLGALLLGTSVLYGKLGPRLLREDERPDPQVTG